MSNIKFIPVTDLSKLKSIASDQTLFEAKKTENQVEKDQKNLLKLLKTIFVIIALACIVSASYIHIKAYFAQYLLSQAWQQSSADNVEKPWPWFDSHPVAKINFPTLGNEQIVLAGDSGQALAFGPGLSHLSVQPGEEGTLVISGHRDTHFSLLQYLNPTEEVILESISGEQHSYKIHKISVVDIDEVDILQTEYERLLLVTCFPFDSDAANTPLRYIIEALPVEDMPQSTLIAKQGARLMKKYRQNISLTF
ncbi:class GN sortase [Thalassotalea psychrophila]|uniref:Class GN sortase n=1 Tax=Thalassotalea psychrophila TaxID=3065647 RepID=A0ABY9TRX3_9GAMM|nr:class GN sortase [Colwelliaceae bacterium SQ149]